MREPFRFAICLALGYFAVAFAYILFSGDLAARYSDTLVDLQRIEWLKGGGFIVVTSLLLFGFAFFLLRKLALHERSLSGYRHSLVAANQRAAAGLFASSVAHDINNILMVIENVVEELNEASVEDRELLMQHLVHANSDLKALAARLTTARAGARENSEEKFDLVEVTRRILHLVRSHKKATGCDFRVEAPSRLSVYGRPALMHQMLLNLLINAAEATKGEGRVEVKLIERADETLIEVHDDGPGVPEKDRARIMEPFITSKSEGCGLGLLSVQICAEEYQGKVSVGTSHLGGACFRIHLREFLPGREDAPEE